MATLQELEARIERLEQEVMALKMWLRPSFPSAPRTPDELARRRQVGERILAFAERKCGTGIVLSDMVMEWRKGA